MRIDIHSLPLKVSILLFSAVMVGGFYILRAVDYQLYARLIEEDGVVEYLTAALYLASSLVAIGIAVGFRKKSSLLCYAYAFLALGLFFVFGEEISWGQRILDIPTPEIVSEHNHQDEINLHNLDIFMGKRGGEFVGRPLLHKLYMIVGLYGAGSWVLLRIKQRNVLISPYFIPEWYLAGYFLQVLIYYVYNDYIKPETSRFSLDENTLGLSWAEQEPAELILGVGFFLFVLINKLRQIHETRSPQLQ